MLKYRIRYTWPDGKVRYRKDSGLCVDQQEASVFTLYDASLILKLSNDARIVWGIKTVKEQADDCQVLPLLHDPDEDEESHTSKRRSRKKRKRRSKRP